MLRIIIINGPNLNLIGKREPSVYGNTSFDDYFEHLKEYFSNKVELTLFQSNIEGELIDMIQKSETEFDGIVLNAGGYSHTSVAIADSISAIKIPVIEVHISNLLSREPYRHISLIGKNCAGSIMGFGLEGYKLAIQSFVNRKENSNL
jgi:3-dehydroquinate dehydratase-2